MNYYHIHRLISKDRYSYPVLNTASISQATKNFVQLVVKTLIHSVNQGSNKKTKSREEQREIFQNLLALKEIDTQAEIARKFGFSRAWVSKVLS